MPEVISRLLSSRKFVVAVTALVVAIAARLGLPADVAQEIAGAVLAIGATYVAAQGASDFGKEAAANVKDAVTVKVDATSSADADEPDAV